DPGLQPDPKLPVSNRPGYAEKAIGAAYLYPSHPIPANPALPTHQLSGPDRAPTPSSAKLQPQARSALAGCGAPPRSSGLNPEIFCRIEASRGDAPDGRHMPSIV